MECALKYETEKRKCYTAEQNVGIELEAEIADGFNWRFGQTVLDLRHHAVVRTLGLCQSKIAVAQLVVDVVIDGAQPEHGAVVVFGPARAAACQTRGHAELDGQQRRR